MCVILATASFAKRSELCLLVHMIYLDLEHRNFCTGVTYLIDYDEDIRALYYFQLP